MKLKSIKQIKKFSGRRFLVRVDFNVPVENGEAKDITRIKKALPTISYLRERGGVVILISHLGRPGKNKFFSKKEIIFFNKKNFLNYQFRPEFSLKKILPYLKREIGDNVFFLNDCVGRKVKNKINKAQEGDIFLLENVRFYKEEKENNKVFAQALADLAEVYINEAFSVSHRQHASVAAVADLLPAYAGLLFQKEIVHLNKLFFSKKPYVLLLGGAKLSTKVKLIKNLGKRADKILLGGALANVFLEAQGREIGRSFREEESFWQAKILLKSPLRKKIILPEDVAVWDYKKRPRIRFLSEIKKSDIISDIGPKTILNYSLILKKARTILWNGPMGKYEIKPFGTGSLSLARIIASVSSGRAFGVIGGGETVDIAQETKMLHFFDWVSTGGGAMLAFLGKERMPALERFAKN